MNRHPKIAPAADRNKDAILDVLRGVLPDQGLVLEIASGTGQHVAHFARALPRLSWQPSDPSGEMRASIASWIGGEGLTNVHAPLDVNAHSEEWPVASADAVICINMIHIAPWAATTGLMKGAARLLPVSAPLILYGPYRRFGRHTAPSNEAFDSQLRQSDPEWGVRDLQDVERIAMTQGLRLAKVVEMPANNLTAVFRRDGTGRRADAAHQTSSRVSALPTPAPNQS